MVTKILSKPNIKVIGVGGSGSNTITIGRKAAEESKEEITEVLKDCDMVFITCGLGGGTGSGATPIISEIAKQQGALTIAAVTKPFSFEGSQRMKIAKDTIETLKDKVDTLLIISNDKVLSHADQNTTLVEAFWSCDDILRQAVQGISDLIVLPGIVNIDFADVKTIMKGSGSAIFGMGRAKGEKRIEQAATRAINSDLLDFSIEGAKGVLFNISGPEDLSLDEIDTAAKIITEKVDSKAKVIFGAVQDTKLQKGEVKITVIATGFTEKQ
jgi:cell division protein FtsZ